MKYTSRCQDWFCNAVIYTCIHDLGLFGGESKTPIEIFSNKPWWPELAEHQVFTCLPTSLVPLATRETRDDGSVATSGNSELLRQSQAYPPAFGVAVEMVFRAHSGELSAYASAQLQAMECEGGIDIEFVLNTTAEDTWSDADPGPLFTTLLQLLPNTQVWCR